MTYGANYYSVLNVRYKERTHRSSTGRGIWRKNQHGWTLSHTVGSRDYGWHKRQIAKQERRLAKNVIAEYDVPASGVGPKWDQYDAGREIDYSVVNVNGLSGDYVLWTEHERAYVFEIVYGACCHICGKEGGH